MTLRREYDLHVNSKTKQLTTRQNINFVFSKKELLEYLILKSGIKKTLTNKQKNLCD